MITFHQIEPFDFLSRVRSVPVVDVRSPGEFAQGHIPGSINVPLFSDDERAVVGKLYKLSGREAATFESLGIVGPKMQQFVNDARRISPEKKLLIHCWRGGMRSESMAWLMATAGFDVKVLKGGYKAYRNYIRENWNRAITMVVVSGKTGSGKTEILKHIQKTGQQVLDLEGYAHHKGSAFGAIGEIPQPTNEQFENDIAAQWLSFDPYKPVWVEDESRFIGRVWLPDPLYDAKQKALTLCVEMPKELRIQRLIKDYAGFPKEQLIQSIEKIGKRIGWNNLKLAVKAIETGDFEAAIDITLSYYDKTYSFDLTKKAESEIIMIPVKTADASVIAQKILSHPKLQLINNLQDG
ncbi:MAG: tRNA 2-selenouridine(34) synthase MnmH [Bacteroidales bacterium]